MSIKLNSKITMPYLARANHHSFILMGFTHVEVSVLRTLYRFDYKIQMRPMCESEAAATAERAAKTWQSHTNKQTNRKNKNKKCEKN